MNVTPTSSPNLPTPQAGQTPAVKAVQSILIDHDNALIGWEDIAKQLKGRKVQISNREKSGQSIIADPLDSVWATCLGKKDKRKLFRLYVSQTKDGEPVTINRSIDFRTGDHIEFRVIGEDAHAVPTDHREGALKTLSAAEPSPLNDVPGIEETSDSLNIPNVADVNGNTLLKKLQRFNKQQVIVTVTDPSLAPKDQVRRVAVTRLSLPIDLQDDRNIFVGTGSLGALLLLSLKAPVTSINVRLASSEELNALVAEASKRTADELAELRSTPVEINLHTKVNSQRASDLQADLKKRGWAGNKDVAVSIKYYDCERVCAIDSVYQESGKLCVRIYGSAEPLKYKKGVVIFSQAPQQQ